MTITFEFEQDFRKYRKYVTYLTKIDEAMGKLPLKFYQGDMLDCFVIERKGDVVHVLLTNNAQELVDKFVKDAQPDTFNNIQEDVAYMYNLAKHELIYNFESKEVENDWNWSSYPETFWMSEDDKYDHGLIMGADGQLGRMYLSNKRLTSLLISIQEVEDDFPDIIGTGKVAPTLHEAGVLTVLSIIARQYGQPEPKKADVMAAIACDLIHTSDKSYAEYEFAPLIKMFELRGNDDDLWEDTWGVAVDEAMARDDGAHRGTGATTLGSLLPSGNLTSEQSSYTNQMCLTDLNDLSEVPKSDRPIYVHMDVPIHGVHYMMIESDQTLAIFFNDQIIRREDIRQHLANLPEDQLALHPDFVMDDSEDEYDDFKTRFEALGDPEVEDMDTFAKKLSGVENDTLPNSYIADLDEELGKSGGRHQ